MHGSQSAARRCPSLAGFAGPPATSVCFRDAEEVACAMVDRNMPGRHQIAGYIAC